jgi:hypothetical protein
VGNVTWMTGTRALFWIYLLLIFGGLVFFSVIGLGHH